MASEPVGAHTLQAWTAGNFACFGTDLIMVGELLCEAADVRAGDKVLDVATGSGNTALAAARRNCDVQGIDFVPTVLEAARRRAQTEGVTARFECADAQALPFSDASFDVVLSTFGVMFAPDQALAASELLRVCRPGGKIALASWTPDSYPARHLALIREHSGLPPPPDNPTTWGTVAGVKQLLGARDQHHQIRSIARRFLSAFHCVEQHRRHCGPTQLAFTLLDETQAAGLESSLLAQALEFDSSGPARRNGNLLIACEYLESVIVR